MTSPITPEIPARDTETEFSTLDRGSSLLSLLPTIGVDVASRDIVDLGTGFGFLAMAAAGAGARVTAVDINDERLGQLRRRASDRGLEVDVVRANLLDPPALGPADVAFLIGVVEYAGLWDHERSPSELQTRVFRTAYDALKPGGSLVFGSKNRLWPALAVRDVHTHRPLVNALPRGLADKLSRRTTGEPYRHHIHSPAGWARLIKAAGFRELTIYQPHFSYQLPVLIRERPGFADVKTIASLPLGEEERAAALGSRWRPKAVLMAAGNALRIPLSHSVIIRATK